MDTAKELERHRAAGRKQAAELKAQREAAKAGELPAGMEKEPDLYAAMCHVMALGSGYDLTPGQKACREWLKTAPGAFMARYGEMQRERKPVAEVEATAAEDEGTEKALRHLERFLEGGDVIDGDMAQEGAQGEDGERPV